MKGAMKLGQLLGSVLILLIALAGAASAQETQETQGEISLYVFDDGRPVEGVTVKAGGVSVVTDETGGVFLDVAPGRRDVVLTRAGEQLLNLDLLTAEGENVQVLVTLRGPGQQPDVNIESSNPAGAGGVQAAGGARAPQENANPGLLKGRVISAEKAEPVRNARVFFSGVNAQARTNAQGQFQVELPPGNYSLSVIHEDFATQTVDNVRVIPEKEVTTTIEVTPAGVQLQEYVVTAPYIEGSVASTISQQRESSAVSDVLGAAQMSAAGDSDAAEALRRVTGLTIEDGKYVVIRGQPSRYTATQWNGSPLPSPDPIRQVVPLDLFPTGVLSSLAVKKSYAANMPGYFGGGLIQLNTRQVPEEGFGEVSVKTGFNTESTGEDGLTVDGGGTDWLGIDDGTRSMPDSAESVGDVSGLPTDEQNAIGRDFSNNYNVYNETLPPDLGLSVAGGGNTQALGGTVGALATFSWDREYRNEERIQRSFANSGAEGLRVSNDFTINRTDMDVTLGGLLTLSGDWGDQFKLTSNTFLMRNTTERVELKEGFDNTSDADTVREFTISWNERQMLVEQLLGEHDFDFVRIDWRAMVAKGERSAPDRRTYSYTQLPNGDFRFVTDPSGVGRRYNETDDDISSFGADATFPVLDTERFKAELATGFSRYKQDRSSETRRFFFTPVDEESDELTSPNPEDFLDPDETGDTVDFEEQTLGVDEYEGDSLVRGYYGLGDFTWKDRVRVVGGVRRETADFSALSFRGSGQDVPGGFKETRLLPSLSATFFVYDDMQVRAAWGKTVSRPTLNELSPAVYFDPDSGDQFVGNPQLKPAKITSFDLRWEWFPSDTESLSVGVFRKDYTDPIEEIIQPVGDSSSVNSVQNADSAEVNGVEFAGRVYADKLLGWTGITWDWLGNSYLQGNWAIIDSTVTLQDSGVATNSERSLQGQADQVVNLMAGYNGEALDWAVTYNWVGERLYRPGTFGRPDIIEEPVASLGLNTKYRFTDALSMKFELSNILDPTHEFTQGGRTWRSYKEGASGSLSVEWQFY